MTAHLAVKFIGMNVYLRRIYENDGVAHYLGDVSNDCTLEATTDEGVWSAEFEGKRCSGQTLEHAVAKLELALRPVALVLAPLLEVDDKADTTRPPAPTEPMNERVEAI